MEGSRLSYDQTRYFFETLKTGTSDARKDWFAVGDYKTAPNEVGGMNTTLPEDVAGEMEVLLSEYNAKGTYHLLFRWMFFFHTQF